MAQLNGETPDSFQCITGAQTSVFHISHGWTGGFGEAVLNPESNRPWSVEGLPVYISSSGVNAIMEKAPLPSSYSGRAIIKARATFHLEKRSSRNFTIPGAPQRSYYSLVIADLQEAWSFAEPAGN